MLARSIRYVGVLLVAFLALPGFTPPSSLTVLDRAEEHGVYARLLAGPPGSMTMMVSGVRDALGAAGFDILADYDVSVGDECAYGAHVFVIDDRDYATSLLSHGPIAGFALPLRIEVFEDEGGVQAAMVNPLSLNRTIVAEEGLDELSAGIVTKVRATLAGAGVGSPATGEFGQMRDRGLIGKTMGIMAGGPFPSKIDDIASVDVADFGGLSGVAEALAERIEAGGGEWKWGIRGVYSVTYPDAGLAIVGVTGERAERDSFSIVGSGTDGSRSDYACPGIDHAAAYPIELVITKEGGEAKIRIVDEMFRMKMYFEDAGKMKFAMNMRMPGSIESEIRDKVEEVLN
jgi:uncharacterized protein (DUF302 family)